MNDNEPRGEERELASKMCALARKTYLDMPDSPPLRDAIALVYGDAQNEDYCIAMLDSSLLAEYEECVRFLPLPVAVQEALLQARETTHQGLLRVVVGINVATNRWIVARMRTALVQGERPS